MTKFEKHLEDFKKAVERLEEVIKPEKTETDMEWFAVLQMDVFVRLTSRGLSITMNIG